ncbi:hypothetical protein BDR07DRAFT_1492864 [Suillus spraguei]|nr:hypothetical protein BDR07DRAFT_1492864 [Suillus spraguei]
MTYCKCNGEKQHEFLLLEFCYSPSASHTTVLIVDRTVNNPDLQNNNNGSSSSRTSGIIFPSASSTPAATDIVYTIPDVNSAVRTYLKKKFRSYSRLCTLDFSAPGVEGPAATQIACYWFAETVWEAVKCLFSGGVEGPWGSGRSCYRGVKIDNPNSVGAVCEKFNSEWSRIEVEAAQEEEVRKQQSREYQAEIERLLAKSQADEALIQEKEQQYQAEIDRLLAKSRADEAKIAELESRS